MKAPVNETPLNGYRLKQGKPDRQSLSAVVEFMAERLVLGSLAALIVYGGYRMFLL